MFEDLGGFRAQPMRPHRAARFDKRKGREADAAEQRGAHPEAKADATDEQSVDDDVEDEEYFDEYMYAPGLVQATPDRPIFTPTPEHTPGS